MRKLLFLVPPTLALTAFALVACEDDTGGVSPDFSFEAGLPDTSSPAFDAGPAPNVDAAPDAPAVPTVSVTVTDFTGPKAGVRVVFHDATGAVIETKLTGSDGKAIHTGTTPAMASALLENDHSRRIMTWTGVENGDDLQVREDGGEAAFEHVGSYDVTMQPFDGGVSRYRVQGSCGEDRPYGTTTSLQLYRHCSRPKSSVLATAELWGTGVIGHAFKKGVASVADGGTLVVTTDAWQVPTDLALTVEHLPAQESFNAELLEISEGTGFDNGSTAYANNTVTFKTATGFAEALQTSVWFSANRRITKRFAPAATASVDYDTLLPPISNANVAHENPLRPVVSWDPINVADGGVVRFWFSKGDDGFDYEWRFVVAPGSKEVTAPAMPDEAAQFLPFPADAGTASSFGWPEVLFVEADVLPGYTAFRRQQGTFIGLDTNLRGELPALPINGTFRTTAYFDGGR
jgi:hypothetical protein